MVKIECVVDVPSRIGESPVWDSRTQTLLWVDIPVGITCHGGSQVQCVAAEVGIERSLVGKGLVDQWRGRIVVAKDTEPDLELRIIKRCTRGYRIHKTNQQVLRTGFQ